MNILCIGNSFSVDATRYLHNKARADGKEINITDLYIGGCSLERHYRNMLSGNREYTLDINGNLTAFKVSLSEALLNQSWDYVTVQQVSSCAPYYETYQPYLNAICEYVRKCAPKAKLLVHQTWAYEEGSKRLNEELGYKHQEDMFADVEASYIKAADEINAEFIIPSGAAFQELIKAGIAPVHRDTFHASLGIGRYTLGLTWYRALTGADVTENTFSDFDEEIPAETVKKIKECVMSVKM